MNLARLFAAVLTPLAATLAVPASSNAAGVPTTDVDVAPAIKVGEFTTSQYLFEKAYRRFVGSGTPSAKREPTSEELEQWFRLHLAQLVIKADLVKQKQLDRAEVVEMTARMARHMLTQPHGPLYRELGAAERNAARERRKRILGECAFFPVGDNVARLWSSIAPTLARGEPLREADVAPMGSVVLATYFFSGSSRRISAMDFFRDYQRAIARLAPVSLGDLHAQIENIAVAEHDFAEAKSRGLDQTPQFLEDRRNFALIQALSLYEKEVLSREVAVSREELTTRYQRDRQRYVSPVDVAGTLFLFADHESARRAVLLARTGDDVAAESAPAQVIDGFVIRRDAHPPPLNIPYQALVSMPIGHRHGPFPHAGKFAVFLKQATGELAPPPFEAVQPELERQLMREKIDRLELDYLTRNASRVELCFDLAAYGLQNFTLAGGP